VRERRVLHGRRGHLYTARLAGARWACSPEPPPGPASPTPAPLPRTDMRRLTGAADKARRAAQAHRVADACALTDCQL